MARAGAPPRRCARARLPRPAGSTRCVRRRALGHAEEVLGAHHRGGRRRVHRIQAPCTGIHVHQPGRRQLQLEARGTVVGQARADGDHQVRFSQQGVELCRRAAQAVVLKGPGRMLRHDSAPGGAAENRSSGPLDVVPDPLSRACAPLADHEDRFAREMNARPDRRHIARRGGAQRELRSGSADAPSCTMTGPGSPSRAVSNAAQTVSARRAGSVTANIALVMGRAMALWSRAW